MENFYIYIYIYTYLYEEGSSPKSGARNRVMWNFAGHSRLFSLGNDGHHHHPKLTQQQNQLVCVELKLVGCCKQSSI